MTLSRNKLRRKSRKKSRKCNFKGGRIYKKRTRKNIRGGG